MTEGFFHADPHPGNLMWWKDRIYFLDFGMVGEVGPELRDNMMLLLMAFWQEDVEFLMDVTLMLSGGADRSDLDVDRFRRGDGCPRGEVPQRAAEGGRAGTDPAGDDRDRNPTRGTVAGLADADRQGDGPDAVDGRRPRSRTRPLRGRRAVS